MAVGLKGTNRRVAMAIACIALAGVVAYVDSISSSHIAFSIFYVVPIAIAAWYGDRLIGLITALVCALGGFAADLSSTNAPPGFAFANCGLRLLLFVLIAMLISRIKLTREREQQLAELEREATQRLQELNDMKDALMRSLIVDAREPLGDIYARIVTLGFDLPTLTDSETRAVLNEIADASRRLSDMVNNLVVPRESSETPASRSAVAPASS